MRPLTKNATNGTYVKYYPSVAFLPSVALGALLTTNWVVVLINGGGRGRRGKKGHKSIITIYDPFRP